MKQKAIFGAALLLGVGSFVMACSSQDPNDDATSNEALTAAPHAQLAPVMPAHLAIMYAMSWFGIPKSGDPLGAGPDSGWGNWKIPGDCSATGEPQECVSGERDVASRYRPLAGIYSSSGRDAESLARIDLMLSTVRRPCANDVGARIDAFAIQLNGTRYTSLHDAKPSGSPENSYQALLHTYEQAEAAGLKNVVLPGDDGTWYWNNGHYEGLNCSTSRSTCLSDLQQDIDDMLTLAVTHPSSLRIDGKPVLFFYLSTAVSVSEWNSLFTHARSLVIDGATHDFVLGSMQGGGGAPYFGAFDGLSPWIDLNAWATTKGATVREHAAAYAAAQHKSLYDAVPAGKVVLGGIAPGFDDFTNGWSRCATRQIPAASEAKPRDPGVLDGELDFMATKHAKGLIFQTWDDWTEGSFFEPSVSEGTSKIVQLQTRLGELYGEAPVSSSALTEQWTSYGQPRGCGGAKPSPKIDLCAKVNGSCGAPQIMEPFAGEDVGGSIHLRVTLPSCLHSMIPYIDGKEVTPAAIDKSIDAWVPVSMGSHVLNVNGWDDSGAVYVSPKMSFTRTY